MPHPRNSKPQNHTLISSGEKSGQRPLLNCGCVTLVVRPVAAPCQPIYYCVGTSLTVPAGLRVRIEKLSPLLSLSQAKLRRISLDEHSPEACFVQS